MTERSGNSHGNKVPFNGYNSEEYLDRLEPNGNIPTNKSDLGYGKRKYKFLLFFHFFFCYFTFFDSILILFPLFTFWVTTWMYLIMWNGFTDSIQLTSIHWLQSIYAYLLWAWTKRSISFLVLFFASFVWTQISIWTGICLNILVPFFYFLSVIVIERWLAFKNKRFHL